MDLIDQLKQQPKTKKEQKLETQVIYKTKEVIRIPFDERELGYIEKALSTYLSSYKGNIKKSKKPTELAGNYLDILYMLVLYEKLTNTKYYEKELFELMKLEKGVNIQELIKKRRELIK